MTHRTPEPDIHDEVLVVFSDPQTGNEIEVTIMDMVNAGVPYNGDIDEDYVYVRTIKRPALSNEESKNDD